MQLETLERWVLARYQAALTAQALGSEAEVPDFEQARQMLDDYLVTEPARLTAEQTAEAEWRQAVGLGDDL